MPARVSEAFVLRSYPFEEGDLIVSFFTRDQGKLRGVAKRARRLKSQFGSGLERLSQVRVSYYQKENAELVRMDGCEIIQSQFAVLDSYDAGVALDFIAEVSGELLPPAAPDERFYRLIGAVLADLRADPAAGVWRAATYFSYWAVRLSGLLPELRVSETSRELMGAMAVRPIAQFAGREWTRQTAADLRRALCGVIEAHIERKLATVPLMEAM
jgi:DNA repair protein RecO (recombination protein O)